MYSLLMGIGLSSSTGYKPFIPLLIIGISSRLGFIELTEQSQWISSTLFICILVALSVLEVFSASIPIIGRIFEVLGIPITLVCGYITITSLAGNLVESNIIIKHLIGILLGSGTAGLIKTLTIIKNTLSDTVTFGLSSFLNSMIDTIKAIFISIVAIVAPILGCIILVASLFITYRGIKKLMAFRNFKGLKRAHS
ncbi:hypothetical protein J2Z23_002796 [Lederbergia galactosidilyticus]|uniref:DUF4126 domain-containing protein n=1 Tax=Lederbergia galactosidilytica TaxID=217031 RepID=UPI001AE6E9FD|nr:DUF4126 domain-containing protein [Lederbergia galactosidilytica]MBP1915814.1 hypothetical protein [Lederbergia galactosidilytica]